MESKSIPNWIIALEEQDTLFLKRFLLASGSLKQLAAVYGVSYPTIRTRLDRIIDKVKASESPSAGDSFERLIDVLVDQGIMIPGTARTLLQSHQRVIRDVSERVERTAAYDAAPDERHE